MRMTHWSTVVDVETSEVLAAVDVGVEPGRVCGVSRTGKWAVQYQVKPAKNMLHWIDTSTNYAGSQYLGGPNAHGTWSSARIGVCCGPSAEIAAPVKIVDVGRARMSPHHQRCDQGISPDRIQPVGVQAQ